MENALFFGRALRIAINGTQTNSNRRGRGSRNNRRGGRGMGRRGGRGMGRGGHGGGHDPGFYGDSGSFDHTPRSNPYESYRRDHRSQAGRENQQQRNEQYFYSESEVATLIRQEEIKRQAQVARDAARQAAINEDTQREHNEQEQPQMSEGEKIEEELMIAQIEIFDRKLKIEELKKRKAAAAAAAAAVLRRKSHEV